MSDAIEKYNKQGVRTRYVSTTISMALVLFVVGVVLCAALGIYNVQHQAKESLQGDIFFSSELNDSGIKQLEVYLKTWDEFKSIRFVSSERAMQEFGDVNKDEIKALFDGQSPLPPSLCFSPKEKFANKKGMKHIKTKLLGAYPEAIIEVNYDEASVEAVNLGFQQFILLFLIIAAFLIIIAVAMINNTIRMSVYANRLTIKTMTLVGATRNYIRKPFIFRAILQGFIAAILAISFILTTVFALSNLIDTIEIKLSVAVFFMLLVTLIFLGVFITVIATLFAVNKYIRTKTNDLY